MLFHRHRWRVYPGSGFGRAQAMRFCKGCGDYETLLYDISLRHVRWVPGNYFEDINSPVFIIAEDDDVFREAVAQLPEQTLYYRASDVSALELMRKWPHPRFILGQDYKDTALSDTPEFLILMMTGHL